MKILFVILGTLWLCTSFLSSASIANEEASEEYVYLVKAEGGKIYRTAEKPAGDQKEWVKKEIRRMELIPSGTTLEIEKGASAFLSCSGCSVLNLTHKDSPYVVRMKDLKKEGSTKSKITEYFTAALHHYIHPDDRPGSKTNLGTRGEPTVRKMGSCRDLSPADNEDIMPVEPLTFKWETKGTRFSLEIKEFGSHSVIFSEKTTSKKIDLPLRIFKPGRKYEWSLLEEETLEKCHATFAILSKEESGRIMEVVNQLPAVLPPGMDREAKCRLQAGYLLSEGLHYDAWKWLERNGITQQ
ncbi:MAG TPA: hypothetical protein VMV04_20685 [Thermodesulfobacteriota bacterium]|nr:hypothetical protein [Thermodesulfobacteriota bacterium]